MKRYINPTKKERIVINGRVNYAVKTGKIIKPDTCTKCESSLRLQAHHDDYNFPLKVRWLCHWCHMKFHDRRNALLKTSRGKSKI